MHITTTKKDLEDVLYAVQRVASPSNPLPILAGVLLSAKGESVTITGTDLNTTVSGSFTTEVVDEGEVVLPGKYFYELVKRLPDGPITLIREQQDCIKVIYGGHQSKVKSLPNDEFPERPKVEGAEVEISTEALRNAIQKVIFACSNEEIDGIFTGVFLRATPFGVEFTATNRRIASYINVDMAVGDSEFEIIIPKTALDFVKIFSDDEIRVAISKNMIAFHGERFTVISRLLTGKFINLATILPKKYNTECEVDTVKLQKILNRAALTNNYATIDIDNNTLTVTSAGEKGSLCETLVIDYDGKANKISLQIKFLMDALAAAGTQARLRFLENRACLVEQGSYYSFIAGALKPEAAAKSA